MNRNQNISKNKILTIGYKACQNARLQAFFTFLMIITLLMTPTYSIGASRIKDIVDFEGIRDNMLVGYGLVVGLNGSGDGLRNAPFTKQSLQSMLERLGVNTLDNDMKTNNVAAVIVTATLPSFSRQGSRIDVKISALGDATSLQGGTLMVTPLLGADGEVYAVAQGAVTISGFVAEGDGERVVQNVPTTGIISNGALVEKEVGFALAELENVSLSLRNPDLTTARRIATKINGFLGVEAATALDPTTVKLARPKGYASDIVSLITDIEQLEVTPDQVARVVIDENSGVIVIGENVKISKVAIAQGNLTIRIAEEPIVSQPNPFSDAGNTVVVPRSEIIVDQDEDRQLGVFDGGITLQELVRGLNSLGISPRDLISILQSIKAAGALQAEIEVR